VEAVVHRAGEGEALFGGRIVIKAASAQLTLTESWSPAARPGAGPHLHRHHTDSFYVLEGELGVTVGGDEHLLGAGGFACVPAGVVHAFRSTGAARFLNLHTPDGGFADNLRALDRGEAGGFDSVEVEPGTGGSSVGGVIVARGEPSIERKELSLAELRLEPGSGAHEQASDGKLAAYYVLDGQLALSIGPETHLLDAGSFALVPPGTAHALSGDGRTLRMEVPG
jgi:quercetin dioxygenase-like cupin family protein